jgi:hypothetical protein
MSRLWAGEGGLARRPCAPLHGLRIDGQGRIRLAHSRVSGRRRAGRRVSTGRGMAGLAWSRLMPQALALRRGGCGVGAPALICSHQSFQNDVY